MDQAPPEKSVFVFFGLMPLAMHHALHQFILIKGCLFSCQATERDANASFPANREASVGI